MSGTLCFGEALIDFLAVGSISQEGLKIPEYRQYPGGAPANVAVAIAKLGGNASFVGQVGSDHFGQFLEDSLNHYGVNTDHLLMHATASTPLAFVRLDASGDRSFEFVRKDTADMLLAPNQIEQDWFSGQDTLHYCSNTLTETLNTETTMAVIEQAKLLNMIISFDVNLRANLWPDHRINLDRIHQCLAESRLIKVSLDELLLIEPQGEESFVRRYLTDADRTILITDGANPVKVIAPGVHSVIKTPEVKAIDTTAAGDAFTGGFLYALSQQEDKNEALKNQDLLESMVVFASICGAITVTKHGAYPSLPDLQSVTTFNL